MSTRATKVSLKNNAKKTVKSTVFLFVYKKGSHLNDHPTHPTSRLARVKYASELYFIFIITHWNQKLKKIYNFIYM